VVEFDYQFWSNWLMLLILHIFCAAILLIQY